jgi:tetratricopeptide (TPR) repeat protein
MYISPAYRLRLYRNFKALEINDYYSIVRYYEQHEEGLHTLDLEEYLDCTLAYTNALFETADYGRHNVMSDHLIELVMAENIHQWGGEDLYTYLLFKKALALSHLGDLPRTIHILRQLIKINPNDLVARRTLFACLQRERPPRRMYIRAISLVLMLIAALATGISGVIVQPFFPYWFDTSMWACGAVLTLGLLILLLGEGWHSWCSWREVRE